MRSRPLIAVFFVISAAGLIAPHAYADNTQLNVKLEPGCDVIAQPTSPYRILKGADNAPLMRSVNDNQGASINGYFPHDTIVQLNSSDLDNSAVSLLQPNVLLPVTVVSVPPVSRRTSIDLEDLRTAPVDYGSGTRAQPGMQGSIEAKDLLPLVGSLTPVGHEVLGGQLNASVFIVKKDSPFYNIPEFAGNAVRFAQQGDRYLTKRCCSKGAKSENLVEVAFSAFSTYENEDTRDSHCNYSPVFELVKPDTSDKHQVKFKALKEFTMGSCNNFLSGLAPVDQENMRTAFALANFAPYSDSALSRLQTTAMKEATVSRHSENHHRFPPGNYSKGLCKQAVNDTLVATGMISHRLPGESAEDAGPSLKAAGFINVLDRIPDAKSAPVPSILVYEGGPHGHIEIKVDNNTYCSDYCVDHPRDRFSFDRKLIGIYVPQAGAQ